MGAKQMTTGERMIWAAVFAKTYDISNPPREVILQRNERGGQDLGPWHEWEVGQAVDAAVAAGYAVERAREVLGEVGDGYGKDSAVYKMLALMIGAIVLASCAPALNATPDAVAYPSCDAPPPSLPPGTCGDYLCVDALGQVEDKSWCGPPRATYEPPRSLITPVDPR